MRPLTLVICGEDPRLPGLLLALTLPKGSRSLPAEAWLRELSPAGEPRTLLFVLCADACGPDPAVGRLLRAIRSRPACLEGAVAAVLALGETELDTKAMARQFFFTADLAGCAFPERPLAEGTGSLRNLRVIRKREKLDSLEEALRFAAQALVHRLLAFVSPRFAAPRLLVLHASDHATSNTLSLGNLVLASLNDRFSVRTLSLRNGTIEDCRGCSYKVCSHYASRGSCFYGGSIAQEVLPAVRDCDALLLLLPNYNDAVGANVMAFINRLTSLHVGNELSGRRLFAVVVSGYSGGDLVAQQALGALCLNKSLLLPPGFCMLETANDPGEILRVPDIRARAAAFAENIARQMLEDG